MASILRSGKFLRYFAGFTRNVVVNSVRDTENGHLLPSTCMCSQFQNYANNPAPKTDVSLEKQLRRLDQDVRRIGRISRRDIEDVLEEMRTQRSATSSQSLLMIRCCGNLVPEEMPEVRTALVQEIWKTLNALNVPMDISHYNALLRVYLENEHSFSPTDFLSEIESKSIEPNRVTYQRLIARYCQLGDIEGATRILEFMRAKSLPVNENVFNSLILGHSQANDMESAAGILSVMKQAGLEPSAETYTTLLCCHARHGNVDSILSILDDCEKNEIFLLDKDLLDVIYNFTIHGNGDKVNVLLKKLRISAGFNQDAVNVILRLVNKGYEDVGLEILRLMPRGTRPDGQLVDAGTFFIKQMVKANRPMDNVLRICKTLQDEGLNPKALLIATEAGIAAGNINNALSLLKELQNTGLPVRQHYFWPLLTCANSNQIVDIIRRMQIDFAISPNAETIRDYVIPNMKETNLDKIILSLRDVGVSGTTAAVGVAYSALLSNKINNAADIMESYRSYYSPQLFKQPLIQALANTNNYSAFIRVVRQIYEGFRQFAKKDQKSSQKLLEDNVDAEPLSEATETDNLITPDVVGLIVHDACAYFRHDQSKLLEHILPELVEQGLSISNAYATRISEKLGADMTPKVSELLGKLSSGELEPVPMRDTEVRKRSLDLLTVDELERFISNVEAKGENSNNLKRQLLNASLRSKNLEKTLQIINKLEADQFTIPSGVWAQLIVLYTHHQKVGEALDLYTKLKQKDPEFMLDNLKTVRVADALINENRFDDAMQFFESNKKTEPFADSEGNSFNYNTSVWRILNYLAEKGEAEKLQRLFDVLVRGNYIVPNNVVMGPLIKVHLNNDNIQGAIEAFEKICEKYKCTPWKNEIACRLIQEEDAANLQKLTDLSTAIHGEVNSLYDLVFSFVECGRIRQARKILETPGLRTKPHRIDNACERYKNEGMVEPLEGLVEATKDLNHIDRNNIFYNLLLSYFKSNDAEKALGLWTKMQEEDVTPSDVFLIKLADLLNKNNIDIPFAVPQNEKQQTVDKSKAEIIKSNEKKKENVKVTTNVKSKTSNNLMLFRKCINSGDIDAAINYKNHLQDNETPSLTDTSHLIEQLVRSDRLNEATKYIKELLLMKQHPLPKIFKFYLNKLAASGDVETMQNIGDKITDEQKKILSFDNRFCNAIISSGRVEQYLKSFYDDIVAVKSPEEAAKLAEKFPRGGSLGILDKHPEMVPQFEKIAEEYAKHNQLGPMNVLWMHLISHDNECASKAIWDNHLSNAPRLMFQRVLQTAREHKDDKLAERVISQLRQSKISEGAIGNAYSCLIDIHTSNGNADKALETLKTAVKDICLENINRTALLRLRTVLEEQNKEFPFNISDKKNKTNTSSSSSSSSEDDVTPKRPETRPSKPRSNTE